MKLRMAVSIFSSRAPGGLSPQSTCPFQKDDGIVQKAEYPQIAHSQGDAEMNSFHGHLEDGARDKERHLARHPVTQNLWHQKVAGLHDTCNIFVAPLRGRAFRVFRVHGAHVVVKDSVVIRRGLLMLFDAGQHGKLFRQNLRRQGAFVGAVGQFMAMMKHSWHRPSCQRGRLAPVRS